MTHSIQQDPRRAAGYAWIDLGVLLPAGPLRFRIERDHPSKPCLGPGGWQAMAADLEPASVEAIDSGVRLSVGPSVVNHVPEYEQIVIVLPTIDFSTDLVWPPIPPLRTGQRAVVDGPAPAVGPEAFAAAKKPSVQQQPEPAPDLPQEPSPGMTMEASVETLAMDKDDAAKKRNRLFVGAALGMLLLVVAGYLAWRSSQTPSQTEVAQTGAAPEATADLDAPGEPGVPAPDASDPRRSGRDRILDPSTTPDELYQLGVELNRGGVEERPLGFEAMFRAADRGHGEAALWMARAYDPRLDMWRQVFGDRANPGNALRYYRRAATLGVQEATAEESALCGWLQQRPGGGSDDEKVASETYCVRR